MKKLIFLLTLVSVSFSADKWEYAIGVHMNNVVVESKQIDDWIVLGDKTEKYNVRDSGKANPQLVGMNKMGKDGWELMFKEKGTVARTQVGNFYYFKRIIK